MKRYARWEDVLKRGSVTLLVPGNEAAYAAGWAAGRRRQREQIEQLEMDDDNVDA